MAGLAYLLPPLSGLCAYLWSSVPRVRFHGLQSILLGVLWPMGLHIGGRVTPGVTQVIGVAGALAWLLFLVGATLGRDPRWPLAGRWLRAAAERSPRSVPAASRDEG
jgi:uncharacterized membrane protein